MHPLGQVVEVLPVSLPFQGGVIELVGGSLIQCFADPQTASGGVPLAPLLLQPADPTATGVVLPVFPQHTMDLIDQAQREVQVI
jgi:hypothetical protein